MHESLKFCDFWTQGFDEVDDNVDEEVDVNNVDDDINDSEQCIALRSFFIIMWTPVRFDTLTPFLLWNYCLVILVIILVIGEKTPTPNLLN